MMDPRKNEQTQPVRARVVAALSLAEDFIYSALGVLLAIYALALLVRASFSFFNLVHGNASSHQIVDLLDQVLMILLVVELLYTVQVSFREHGLVTEPFLVIALISVIRRILVLTAQFPELAAAQEDSFRHAIAELILLTVMVLVLVGALIFMQRQNKSMEAGMPALDRRKQRAGESGELGHS